MRKRLLVLLILCSAVLPARASVAITEIREMVPMSDGVKLDAVLYLPVDAEPGVPLIVRQHGGGSTKDDAFDKGFAIKAVESGDFALLMYSARGHGSSEGIFDFFGPRTTRDVSEMLDWVNARAGSAVNINVVGMNGYSQGGGGSLLPAAQDPRIRSVAVGNTFDDLNRALNPNDCFKASFATGIFAGAYTVTGSRVDDSTAGRWGAQFYTDTEAISLDPAFPSTTDDLHARSPLTHLQPLIDRQVPVFWTQAWEDQLFPADMPAHILQPLADAGVLVHYWFNSGGHAAQDVVSERNAREAAMLNWFRQTLLGEPQGFSNAAQVDYYERVAGRPRASTEGDWSGPFQSATWPIASTSSVLYAHGDGTLSATANTASAPIGPIVNTSASVNVANDALVLEVARNIPGAEAHVRSVPEDGNAADSVTFESAPFEQPLRVVGAPSVQTDLVEVAGARVQVNAKLWDVNGDVAQLIWRGCTSSADAGDQLVSQDLWPNAHTFQPGHSLRLVVSTVDFPTFQPLRTPFAYSVDTNGGTSISLPVAP